MDVDWFKARSRQLGVRTEDIAAAIGRDRSAVSKFYSGHRLMTLEWAKAFADVLDVPLETILEKAGRIEGDTTDAKPQGFSDGDVVPMVAKGAVEAMQAAMKHIADAHSQGVDAWTVGTDSLSLMGILSGDFILVDSHQAASVRAGDVVVAQVYDWTTGTAQTVLRRFEPPVLVAASTNRSEWRVHVVDGKNVSIRGKVVASWRGDIDRVPVAGRDIAAGKRTA